MAGRTYGTWLACGTWHAGQKGHAFILVSQALNCPVFAQHRDSMAHNCAIRHVMQYANHASAAAVPTVAPLPQPTWQQPTAAQRGASSPPQRDTQQVSSRDSCSPMWSQGPRVCPMLAWPPVSEGCPARLSTPSPCSPAGPMPPAPCALLAGRPQHTCSLLLGRPHASPCPLPPAPRRPPCPLPAGLNTP